jgi:hypothetical protein
VVTIGEWMTAALTTGEWRKARTSAVAMLPALIADPT